MTYAELYLAALYDILSVGGAPAVVDAAVEEVNHPTQDGLENYLQTVAQRGVACGSCGVMFHPDEPRLEADVVCPVCEGEPR